MIAYPQVVAGVQQPVPYGVGYHPAPAAGVEPLGHSDEVAHLHLFLDLQRPRLHDQPQ